VSLVGQALGRPGSFTAVVVLAVLRGISGALISVSLLAYRVATDCCLGHQIPEAAGGREMAETACAAETAGAA
jgi:hypothetical protein